MNRLLIRTQHLARAKLRLKVIYLLKSLKEVRASISRKCKKFTLVTKATSDSRPTKRKSKMVARKRAAQTAPRIALEIQMKTRR